jgi:hypothetical protein
VRYGMQQRKSHSSTAQILKKLLCFIMHAGSERTWSTHAGAGKENVQLLATDTEEGGPATGHNRSPQQSLVGGTCSLHTKMAGLLALRHSDNLRNMPAGVPRYPAEW